MNCFIIGGGTGSSFISGYTGCDAIDSNGNHMGQPNHYSGKVFSNAIMISGNEEMPNRDGKGTEINKYGNGYARISIVK